MLKTLRITSLAAVILAVCGVIVIAVFGFRGDSEAQAFLDTPSITEKFKGQETKADKKEGDIHPLVTQAKAFALRINPPAPPVPVKPPVETKPKPEQTTTRQPTPKPVTPTPPVVNASFQVLATVRYETEPSRSLTLLKSGNTYSWFRQGEKAGHLNIDEIRDGSIVVSQAGKNPQTLFVPPKQESKSLLKGDKPAVASARPSTVNMAGAVASNAVSLDEAQAGRVGTASQSRPRVISSRVGRVRAEPPVPTPEEKKAELEQTITGIQGIMNRQDESMTDEQRQAENQMWMELLNALKNEQETLSTADSAAAAPSAEAESNATVPSGEQPAPEEAPEAAEAEETPAAEGFAEAGNVPAEAEGEMPVETEGEIPAEFAPEEAPVEGEGAVGEEGFAGPVEENAEGFGSVVPQGAPGEGVEGEAPAGFSEGDPNEY